MNCNYPRPQLRRDTFMILSKNWQLNGYDINIPYPPEAPLSKYLGPNDGELIYNCTFSIPDNFTKDKILLHFGAVDQRAKVYVNDVLIGRHTGGYLPFSFDISGVIKRNGLNHLEVLVTDKLSTNFPYGKQKKKHGGMWYTPVSGIWQSVWLENVDEIYIKDIKLKPSMNSLSIKLDCNYDDLEGFDAFINLPDGNVLHKSFKGNWGSVEFEEKDIVNWSPTNPHIYNMTIKAGNDCIYTYFALREIEIMDVDGIQRVCLNKKPIFMHGVLDQGYFQDGLFIPKNFSEYENDILRMKELGFNTLRKHIKIEPEQFYYYCDIHGMLVVQDMVNSGRYSFFKDTFLPTIGFRKINDVYRRDKRNKNDGFRRAFFEQHMIDTINTLYNHPCIIAYTIFNEGWGQFNSDRMYDVAKKTDPSRLYDATSGWFAQHYSDFDSEHVYFRSKRLKPKERPLFLSECGGFTYKVNEHYSTGKTYGYGACKNSEELTKRITDMYETMVIPAIHKGLCGCIYTQLSDIEDEINGFYTYDREVCKVDKDLIFKIGQKINDSIS